MNEFPVPDFARTIVRDVTPDLWAGAPLVILVACDCGYLDDAVALLRSLNAASPQAHIVLHVVNPAPDTLPHLESISDELPSISLHLSAEKVRLPNPRLKRAYYASARFVRLAELLPVSTSPFLVLDADSLFVAPIDLDFTDKEEADVCLRRRDQEGEVAPHLQVAAGAVWARPVEPALEYFRAVAADLLEEFTSATATWFIDQIILARHMKAATGGVVVRNIKSKYVDWTFRDDSIVWTGKGDRKFYELRYQLLRLSFDHDRERRRRGRDMLDGVVGMGAAREGAGVLAAAARRLRAADPISVGIWLPRLDLPWKPTGLARGDVPTLAADVVDLRLWWKRFAMEVAAALTAHRVDLRIFEVPAWEIDSARVDEAGVDLALIPHRCREDFAPGATPRRFFMQQFFRPVFTLDREGWGASASVYPIDASALPPAVLGAWEHYRRLFESGSLQSKFDQQRRRSHQELVNDGQLPPGKFAFFPLQIPDDQSIRYFSDVDEETALCAAVAWAERAGIRLVVKEHPANRSSMGVLRSVLGSDAVHWTEAHVHDVIRFATGVITMNSGVGFEALFGGVPIVVMARTEYDCVAHKAIATADGLAEAWKRAQAEDRDARWVRYARFVDWFLGRHAIDLSRPAAARYVLDRHLSEALAEARTGRERAA